MAKSTKPLDEFYIIDNTGCWICIYKPNPNGYVSVTIDNKSLSAHKYFYERYKGEVPQGKQLHHTCEVRRCINPEHLELVDVGVHHLHHSKMTFENAQKIRKLYPTGYTMESLAQMFKVTTGTIHNVIHNRYWTKPI